MKMILCKCGSCSLSQKLFSLRISNKIFEFYFYNFSLWKNVGVVTLFSQLLKSNKFNQSNTFYFQFYEDKTEYENSD